MNAFKVVQTASDSMELSVSHMPTLVSPRLMFFDLAVGGHHATYIRYLVQYWVKQKLDGSLIFLVSPDFLEKHSDVVSLASDLIEFITISDEENRQLKKQKSIIKCAFLEWNLFCTYARNLKIEKGFLLYFDYLQLPIVFGQLSPCPFSGIYFRPTFHYSTFEGHVDTFKDTWRGWRQKILLALAMRNKRFLGLLSLDAYAVPYIEKIVPKDKFVSHLPDPVDISEVADDSVYQLKKELHIEENRKVFLLFGRLTERKGIYQVLDAMKSLKPEISKKCCLLLVGEIPDNIYRNIEDSIELLNNNLKIQVIIKEGYQKEENIPAYFSIADVILAPYQNHVGMSGIIVLGMAYEKVIMASSYGLMGEFVKRYSNGICLAENSSDEIVYKISKFLATDHLNEKSNNNGKVLTKKFCPYLFGDTIINSVLA